MFSCVCRLKRSHFVLLLSQSLVSAANSSAIAPSISRTPNRGSRLRRTKPLTRPTNPAGNPRAGSERGTLIRARSSWARLRLLLNDVLPKHEADFSHGSRLILVVARLTESGTRSDVAGVNVSQVSADEEAATLKSGCYGD